MKPWMAHVLIAWVCPNEWLMLNCFFGILRVPPSSNSPFRREDPQESQTTGPHKPTLNPLAECRGNLFRGSTCVDCKTQLFAPRFYCWKMNGEALAWFKWLFKGFEQHPKDHPKNTYKKKTKPDEGRVKCTHQKNGRDFYGFLLIWDVDVLKIHRKNRRFWMLRWVMVDLTCEFCDEQFNKHN